MSEWSANKVDKVAETWTALTQMFGPRLVRDYGQSAPDAWRNVIGAMSTKELEWGLKKLLECDFEGAPKPGALPTLNQFIRACRAPDESPPRVPPNMRLERKRDPWLGHAFIYFMRWSLKRTGIISKEQAMTIGRECERIAKAYSDLEKSGEPVTKQEMNENLLDSFERVLAADHQQVAQ